MTIKEEEQFNEQRDKAYLAEAEYVWNGDPKGVRERYFQLQRKGLYNGTSFQKKYFPERYEQYLSTIKNDKQC